MSRSPSPASWIVAPVLTALSPTAKSGRRDARWRIAARTGLPVIGVILVVALIAVIAFYIYESNRRGAVTLSNDLITAIDRRVGIQMHSYLLPAQQFVELADAAAGGRGVFEGGPAAEQFALHALPKIQPAAAFTYADPEGNFLFVIRNHHGGFDTKTIDRRNGGHKVTWVRRDASGKVTGTEEDPTDTYDPRTRPWYQGAETTKRPFWTDSYLFFTLQKPGISMAVPHYDADGTLQSVIGIDIELATLCAFLKQLSIGVSGKAMIIDHTGRIVAYPSDHWLAADRPDVKPPLLDELGDPVLTRVYNRLRVEGYGRKVLEIGDRRIIVSSEPVDMLTGRNWVVLIVVPETDFVGFVADSGWVALFMSGAVVVIVAALAGLLAWRSVQAERRASAAAARQQALEMRTQTFIDLARHAALDRTAGEGLGNATENAATACAAKRVAVWRLSADGRTLQCDGLLRQHGERPHLRPRAAPRRVAQPVRRPRQGRADRHRRGRSRPQNLRAVPALSPAARDQERLHHADRLGRTVAGHAVGRGPAARRPRCRPGGLLRRAGDPVRAALCDRRCRAGRRRRSGAGRARGRGRSGGTAEERPPDSFAQRQARLERTLLQQNTSIDALRDNAISRAVVGVVKLPDWTSVAQPPTDSGERTAMDAIVHELRRAIERSGVSYAALLDDQIVLAAFSAKEGKTADDARCVATAVLALRDRLLELEERWNVNLDFRLAIDIGTVMTSTVGTEPPSRNLWGGAVGVAKILAASAGRRSIAASETAYDLLSGDFLFRPRGTYFLPETGTMRTFVLVGRI